MPAKTLSPQCRFVRLVILFSCWNWMGIVRAQDFRIYTPVFDQAAATVVPRAGGKPQAPIIDRCQSLFHAQKAYNYVEGQGLLTVYDSVAQSFHILDTQRDLVTHLPFEKVESEIREAEVRAEKYLLKSREAESTESEAQFDMIEFQLRPQFKETFDRRTQLLMLSHPLLTYEVRCETPPQPEIASMYLKYCDWTAKLNYVRNPQAPLPGPRLVLNESLRKRGLMPVSVTLRSSKPAVHLRAEHQIQWQLDAHDRQRIHEWDLWLAKPELQMVTFEKFQDVLLAGPGK